jgi:hypothetical protein
MTVNVAGVRLNVPPVSFEVCDTEIVADPTPCGVTVNVLTSPQLVNVRVLGLTVATPAFDDATERPNALDPVRLHPFLPSPLRGTTASCVVPADPPSASGISSAAASVVASRLLVMSSAYATDASATNALNAPANNDRRPRRVIRPRDLTIPPQAADDNSPQPVKRVTQIVARSVGPSTLEGVVHPPKWGRCQRAA